MKNFLRENEKYLTTLAFFALLLSCSSTEEVDLYKEYKPKTWIYGEKKISSKSTNKEILESEELRQEIFDRTNRKFKKILKGVWVATVFNLDFQKHLQQNHKKLKINEIVKKCKKMGIKCNIFPCKTNSWCLI